MGLCIDPEDNPQGVGVEVRRESVVLGPTGIGNEDKFWCNHNDWYGSSTEYVEIDKSYLKKLVDFFNAHPEHLEAS